MAQTMSDPCSAPHENEFVSGYPPSICDHVPSSKYLCCNCNNVLKKAQQTVCGHRYCSPCLAWIIRNCKFAICPRCTEDPSSLTEDSYLTEDKAFSDTAIDKEISELKVHCVVPRCEWSGILREYEDHQNICDFGTICCPTSCGKTLQRRFLAEHLDHECSINTSESPRCPQRNSRHQGGKTSSKDPRVRTSDPPAAKGRRPHTATDDCLYAPLGCTYRGSLDQVKEHEKSAAASHMALFLPVLLQSGLPTAAETENGFCDYSRDTQISIYNGESVHEEIETDCGHHNSGVTRDNLLARICALETRIQVAENIITVMNREIDSNNAALAAALEETNEAQRKLQTCEAKIADLHCTVAKKCMEMDELHLQLATLEETSYDGVFLWKIFDFTRKCKDASLGRTISLYSPAFYTAKYGYKVCLRIYLNGDGAGKGTHISLFFTIMRGNYDVLLPWPFKHKVTFMLVDQSNREHIIDAFRPDTTSISFQRPENDMNIASGCPLFYPLSKLQPRRNNYVRDDTMFIRCIIDMAS